MPVRTCPECGKTYTTVLGEQDGRLIHVQFPKAKPWEREQLVSGVCSDECWNKLFGDEPE